MRIALIVNPVSGLGTASPGASATRLELARALVANAGTPIDLVQTKAAGHAAELSAQFVARGFDRVIAWGGDGTINEAAGPLIGTQTALGFVRSGSGDGLARSLGMFQPTAAAFRTAVHAAAAPIDVGMLGERHFLNIGGVGFDAAVAMAFERRTKRGRFGYVPAGLGAVWSYKNRVYDVTVEDERVQGEGFVVAFANGRQYGSGLVLAPDADPTDGQLDMVMVSGGPPWIQLWRARRLAWRRMAPATGVRRERITSASITGEHLHGHVDGQLFEASGTLHVRIKPKAILIAGYVSRARK